MSTDPTQILDPTAATEAAIDIESIKEIMDAFAKRNEELKSGEWKNGWHAFCVERSELYYSVLARTLTPEATDEENDIFGHFLDCEAHTDVWRELFKTYNHTNCLDEK